MTEPRTDLWTTGAATGFDRRNGVAHAVPTGRPGPTARSGRRWWPVALLAFVAVASLLLGLVRCSAEAAGTDAPAAPAVPTAVIARAGAGVAPPAPVPGSLTTDTTSLFAAATSGDRGLVPLAGQTATGHAVPVQSVPADEGFWIGSSDTERVWVQFTTNVESGITITPGQLLDLSGPIVTHGPDFAVKAGVSAADGADQLTREGAHLEVDPNRVTVVGPR